MRTRRCYEAGTGRIRGLSLKALLLCTCLLGVNACATVGPGSVGVLWKARGGTQPEPYGEGVHAVPRPNKMYVYDARTLSHDEVLRTLASDGLLLTLNATVRYRIVRQEVVALHTQVGLDYYEKIIGPVLRSEARRLMSRYTPEEIYSTRREEIERETTAGVMNKIRGKHLEIEAVLIRNVELPASLRAALDLRAVAEQEVLRTRTLVQVAKASAEQRRVEAQGVADYNRNVSGSLSPSLLEFDRNQQLSRLAVSPNAKMVVISAGAGGRAPALPGHVGPVAGAWSPSDLDDSAATTRATMAGRRPPPPARPTTAK